MMVHPSEWLTDDVFVLGAPDAEMSLIEEMLRYQSRDYVYAMSLEDDRRVSHHEAERGLWRADLPSTGRLILVELGINESVAGREFLVIDHHVPHRPPFPSVYQVATYLMLGERGMILGACDHDLRSAYRWFPVEKVLEYRSQELSASLCDALDYYVSLYPTRFKDVLLGIEPPPSKLIEDVLLSRGQAALVSTGESSGGCEYTLVGDVSHQMVESLAAAFQTAGYKPFTGRMNLSVTLPSHDAAVEVMHAVRLRPRSYAKAV